LPNDKREKFNGLLPKEATEDDTLFDRLFTEAAAQHLAEQEYPSREALTNEVFFSSGYEARLKAQLKRWEREAKRKQKRRRAASILLKTASIVIAFMVVFGLFVVTSTAAKNRVFNFFNSLTENSVDISFSDEDVGDEAIVLAIPEGIYYPTYLPKGFDITSVNPIGSAVELVFTNGSEMLFVRTYTEASSITVNNENTEISTFNCQGVIATMLEAEDDVVIYFKKGNTLVLLSGDISPEKLKKIAKSLIK